MSLRIGERERVATLKASHLAYLVLVLGMLVTVISAFVGITTFLLAHLPLLFLVLAEVAKSASQLVYSRWGTITARSTDRSGDWPDRAGAG